MARKIFKYTAFVNGSEHIYVYMKYNKSHENIIKNSNGGDIDFNTQWRQRGHFLAYAVQNISDEVVCFFLSKIH
jgi:hypothetical protein